MKKLLYTTAIAGLAMTYASVSSAETKISGNLGLSYFSSSDSKSGATVASPTQSFDGFGKESQINITKSGDLNNGMKYVAGFSLEMDGADTGETMQGQQNENVFIDFIAGNTTISVGADHFQNTDVTMTNLVGFGYLGADGASSGTGVTTAVSIYPQHGSNYSAYGIGVLQKTDVGSFGINFTPAGSNATAVNDIGNAINKSQVGSANAATEITFRGSLGVKGLDVLAGHKKQDRVNSSNNDTRDRDATRFAAKYSVGAVTVALDHIKTDGTGSAAALAGVNELTGKSIGIAYSISDKLSIGYTRAEADSNKAGSKDEDTDLVAVGYNLGPVSVQAQYKDVENLEGVQGQDGKIFGLYLGTKF
jgi:hypothetical protein